MSWVWDHGPDDPQERYVLLKLADNANQDGLGWPSLAEISECTKLSEQTVRRAIKALEVGGWIIVKRGVGRGVSSEYVLIRKGASEIPFAELKKVPTRHRKGANQTQKGAKSPKPPTPPLSVNRQEPSGEPSQKSAPLFDRPVNLDSGCELLLAAELVREINVPMENSGRAVIADCIRVLAKEGGDEQTAYAFLLEAARDAKARGEPITKWWFADQRYLPQQPRRKETERERKTREFEEHMEATREAERNGRDL